MPNKLDLSVAIITYNEQRRLAETLLSVKDFAKEIIIVDSHSTDNTVQIAQEFNAKVYTHDWEGFVIQKNFLTSYTSCKWILYLDADEIITPSLQNEIKAIIAMDEKKSYEINRLTFYMGKLLKYAWQPNYRVRLVRKDSNPIWEGHLVHESLKTNYPVERINDYMVHKSYYDIQDHFQKTIKYAKLSAQSYKQQGKKASVLKLIFSPIFSAFKLYIIHRGYKDGIAGLIAAFSALVYTFLKYAFLFEKDKQD